MAGTCYSLPAYHLPAHPILPCTPLPPHNCEHPLALAAGGGGGSTSAACGAEPLSVEEEGELLKYYSSRLQHICRELRLPRRVPGAAVAYLKRIYLAHSCLEQDPQQLLLTCLYLACKASGRAAGGRQQAGPGLDMG